MSDEPKKDGVYISVELPKGYEPQAGDRVSFTTRWQSDAPEYAEATSVFGRPVSVDIDADACGFLKADDDDEVIAEWQKCHCLAAAPKPLLPWDIVTNEIAKAEWREDAAARIRYFGRRRKAVLTKFEVTEETPPALGKCHIWTAVEVTDPT